MRYAGLFGLFLIGCTAAATDEKVGRVESRIINGRPSGDDENADVFIVTKTEDSQLRCSGRIIAPGLVASARHCFLKRPVKDVQCNPDGSPVDLADAVDYPLRPAEAITVYIGATKSTQRAVAVKKVVQRSEISVCRGDMAYLVLAEAGLDQRTPVRRETPVLRDEITVSGWGYVDDTQRVVLPDARTTIDTSVTDYGPPALPPGVFSVAGKTLCLGDSGAAALVDGALLGTYSRIDNPDKCTSEFTRNFLTAVMSDPELLRRAYSEIGEEPWFVGEQKPWLATAGATCQSDDQCASNVCEEGACRPGCGATGLACALGQSCTQDGKCMTTEVPDAGVVSDAGPIAPAAAPAPKDDGGCMTTRGTSGNGYDGATWLVVAVVVAIRRRRITG